MKILLDRLTGTPAPFTFEAKPAWWRERCDGDRELDHQLAESFRIEIIAHRMGSDLYLEGSLSGAVEAECSRCLARYRHALREGFRLVLEPAGDRVPADPDSAEALQKEGLCLGEDLEAGWYRGYELQLDSFFAELIALAMPVQPLCREECAGLCPVCGVDLNQSTCTCAELKPDSPFATLAALKGGTDGGKS
jgi:uncharacterized protein